jgi:hypothetical protein
MIALKPLLAIIVSGALCACGLSETAVTGTAGVNADVEAAKEALHTEALVKKKLNDAQAAAQAQTDDVDLPEKRVP